MYFGDVDSERKVITDSNIIYIKPMIVFKANYSNIVSLDYSNLSNNDRYGDVTPTNDLERACSTCLALTGATVFAYTALIEP